MSQLPDLPDTAPEPGSRAYADRLTINMCACVEDELIPMLEALGRQDKIQGWRLRLELMRAAALADTPEQLAVIERMDKLIGTDDYGEPVQCEGIDGNQRCDLNATVSEDGFEFCADCHVAYLRRRDAA